MVQKELTQQELIKLMDYNPETGLFVRKVRQRNLNAGTVNRKHGYIDIRVLGKTYRAHRLVWFYVYGEWPLEDIDHINGIKTDNRLCNLRSVSRQQNLENLRKPTSRNTSGFLGVTKHKKSSKWISQIRIFGKVKKLGYFETPDLAHQAYLVAKRQHHAGCTI